MPVVRKKVQKGFTIIPNVTIRDKSLNLKDRGMICYLLSLPDNWEFSVEGLVAMMPKDGRTTVMSSLDRLEELGYLERSQERGKDGKVGSAIWTIYDRPSNSQTLVATDQNAEKPSSENPTSENQTQRNKESNKEPSIDKQKGIRSKCKNRKTEGINRENQKIKSVSSDNTTPSCPDNRATKSPVSKKSRIPTVQDVADYCLERHNGIDPEEFYDFYEANGWIQGKGKPIQDWKAAVRTWERRDKQGNTRNSRQGRKGNPFMDMTREGDEIVYEQEPDFETAGNTKGGVSFLLPECRNAGT